MNYGHWIVTRQEIKVSQQGEYSLEKMCSECGYTTVEFYNRKIGWRVHDFYCPECKAAMFERM